VVLCSADGRDLAEEVTGSCVHLYNAMRPHGSHLLFLLLSFTLACSLPDNEQFVNIQQADDQTNRGAVNVVYSIPVQYIPGLVAETSCCYCLYDLQCVRWNVKPKIIYILA